MDATLYQFLLDKATSGCILANERLVFSFPKFEIIFDLETRLENIEFEDGRYESDFEPLTELILEEISSLRILSCFLASNEYLGFRPNIPDHHDPVSICAILYNYLSAIHKFDIQPINKYRITQNDGYNEDSMGAWICGLDMNYLFQIFLSSKQYENRHFYKVVLSDLEKMDIEPPSNFYWKALKNNEPIRDDGKLIILTTNTKTRRLGYLKSLTWFMANKKRYAKSRINNQFEDFAVSFDNQLMLSKNNKGKIDKTKSGNSARPYIKLAEDLGLLLQVNNVYVSGKSLKVFQVLQTELFDERSKNIFEIGQLDKFFFLELIICKDYLYTFLILELIYVQKSTHYSVLKTLFQDLLIERLNEYLDQTKNVKPRQFKHIKKVLDRVKRWEEPGVYLEHILMPRLNWLYDLDLVSLTDQLNVKLNASGKRLFEQFCYWNDINAKRAINPTEFVKRYAIHAFHTAYENPEVENHLEIEKIRDSINQEIYSSFNYFRTLAPNRITASQAISYVKYKLYFSRGLKISHRFIENHLNEYAKDLFIYKYQKQYSDGYIQKK